MTEQKRIPKTLTVHPEDYNALKKLADETNRTLMGMVAELLRVYDKKISLL